MVNTTEDTTDFQALFYGMTLPRFIVRQDEDDAFILDVANTIALQFFVSESESESEAQQGVTLQTLFPDHQWPYIQQSLETCVAKESIVTVQIQKPIPGIKKTRDFTMSPMFDRKGRVCGVDVTGQLQASNPKNNLQRERDDAVSLMSSIFDVSEVGIVVTDSARKIVRVNDSFIRAYGWAEEDLLDQDIAGFVTQDLRELIQKEHEEHIKSGLRSSGEIRMIRKDGSIADVLYTTATIELSQRRRFQVSTMIDITMRKRMEESLRAAKEQADSSNQAKSTFLANMSHELRTPLNAIIGFSEIMIEQTFGAIENERYAEYMKDIHASADHLLEIINEVLDMSKIESGKLELEEQNTDAISVLDDVSRMMGSRAFGKSIDFIQNIQDDFPVILCDERLLRQVFINVISNAVKFSPEQSNIHLSAYIREDDRPEFMIKDEGAGIPKEKIAQALEPFGQVYDTAEHSSKQGTGLGLPLAKAMVELHGGRFDLQSKKGEGTAVIITLPASRIIREGTA